MRTYHRTSQQRDRRFARVRRTTQSVLIGSGVASGILVGYAASTAKPLVPVRPPTTATATTATTATTTTTPATGSASTVYTPPTTAPVTTSTTCYTTPSGTTVCY